MTGSAEAFLPIFRHWKTVVRSRLGWRIALVVFLSIIVIEAAILLPSYRNYERDLLRRVEESGLAAVRTAFTLTAHGSERDALLAGRLVSRGPMKGGSLYRPDGHLIGSFGETPALALSVARKINIVSLRSDDRNRYDVLWTETDTGLPYTVVGRMDTEWVDRELIAFVWRIGGLVVAISVFVTGGTLLALLWLVLTPVFNMHKALLAAREDPAHADEFVSSPVRADELGDMANAVNALLIRVSATHREDLATLGALVQAAQDGVVVYDGSGKLLYANDACLRMCGCLGVDEMRRCGQPKLSVESQSGRKNLLLPGTGCEEATEAILFSHAGTGLPCLVRRNLIQSEDGEVLRYFAVISDISALRDAYDRLARQNAELVKANRVKTEFLANMSHELRTPLNAIIGFSEIIKTGALGPVGDRRYLEYADDIHRSGHHLLGTINDILDLTRIESGNTNLTFHAVDLTTATLDALKMMGQKLRESGLQLDASGLERPHRVNGDERGLRQIILNLLSNAVKFTTRGGRIEVCIRREDAATVLLQVKDTGCGIPPTHIDHITKPFVQVESAFERAHEGAGLGLSLVASMVAIHGGSLDIASIVSQGTIVSVRLPRISSSACEQKELATRQAVCRLGNAAS